MKIYFQIPLLITLAILLAQSSHAQTQPLDKLRQSIESKSDTLETPATQKVDSLRQLKTPSLNTSKADSIAAAAGKPLNDVQSKTDALQQKLNAKTDSLFSLSPKPSGNNKVDDVNDSINTVITKLQEKINQPNAQIQQRTDSVQQKISSSLNRLQGKIEEKLSSGTGEKTSLGNNPAPSTDVPGIDGGALPNASLPGNTSLPSGGNTPAINPDLQNALPSADVPSLQQNGLPSANLPDVKQNIPTTDVPADKIPSAPDLNADKLKDLSPEVKSVTENVEGLEKHSAEVSKMKEGANAEGLSKEATNRVEGTAEIKELAGGIEKAKKAQAEQAAMVKRYQDQKKAYEEMKRKSASIANDQLAKNPELFKNAQEKLSSLKKVKSKSVKFDILKLKSDEFENKKFYHRLVPGATIQIRSRKNVSADLALQLGYRLTPAVTVGIGATSRVYFDKSHDYFMTGAGVHGIRLYTDLETIKGFYLHADFESLKMNPLKFREPPKGSDLSPYHFYGTNFGLGKRFNLSRRIKANALALYRLEHKGYVPETQKFAVRMGFDYVIRKEKKIVVPKVKK